MKPWNRLAAGLLLNACATQALQLESGVAQIAIDGGMGLPRNPAAAAVGDGRVFGGQFLYYPLGDWGIGAEIHRYDFKPKAGHKALMTAVHLVGRGNIDTKSDKYLPYLTAGVGYAESEAGIPGGKDRGSGLGLFLGAGIERVLASRWGLGLEVRLERLSAPLPNLNISGATLLGLRLRANFWFGPPEDPFHAEPRAL